VDDFGQSSDKKKGESPFIEYDQEKTRSHAHDRWIDLSSGLSEKPPESDHPLPAGDC
jgi:hypothetical protein